MALVPGTITASLLSGFIPTMTDGSFSSTVATAVNTYCGTGQITAATMKGTVSAGVFSGSGSGSVIVAIDSADIETVCENMKLDPKETGCWDPDEGETGDDYLAKKLAEIIDDAVTNGDFTILINGSAVAGQVTTTFTNVPTTDVEWEGDPDTLETSLKAAMIPTMTDATFAAAIDAAVTTYLTSATITVNGESALAGATGDGVMA